MSNELYHEDDKGAALDIASVAGGIWREFLKSWWLGFIIVAIFCVFGLVQANRSYVPYYRATASFVVTAEKPSTSISTSQYHNQITAQQLSATFPYIMTSGALSRVVADDLGLPYVPGSISASMLGNTNLFQISVTSSNPQDAYNVLQSVVKNYPSVAEYVIGTTKLRLLEESGVPTEPYNTTDWRNTAINWIAIGGVLYLAVLAFLAINRRTIKNKRDLQQFLSLPYLGGLPQVRLKRRSRSAPPRVLIGNDVPEYYIDAVEKAAARLENLLRRKGYGVVFVTSSTTGEGKTTTSCNLALALAERGNKILLIDGDLRHPSVAKALGYPDWQSNGGLREYLSGRKEASALLQQFKKSSLLVMPGGKPCSNAGQLMGTRRLQKLISQCRNQVDFIIIDTPPCTAMHDATIIAEMADTGLLVVRQDYAPIGRVITATEIMSQVGANLCGSLINGEMGSIGGYSYGKYGYGRYGYGRYGYGRYGYGRYGHEHTRKTTKAPSKHIPEAEKE